MSALPLLMLGVTLADNPHHAIPLDHFAVLADGLHARPYFHKDSSTNRSEKKPQGRPEQ
jgi:hypothetical protein